MQALMLRSASVLTIAALAAFSSAQTAIVVPNVAANLEGNTNNTWPWAAGAGRIRTQWIYASSHFGAVSGNLLVQRLRYRADNAFGTTGGAWNGGAWGQVQIDMSTAARPYNGASLVFADNHGVDRTTVHSGAVTMQPGTYVGGNTTVPGPWYIDIPISVPFVYNPAAGDLCIDLMVDGSTWAGTTTRACDHQSGTQACRIYNSSSNTAAMGLIDNNYALVVEVTLAPLPPLQAMFVATPTRGASPLAVSFTDRSTSTAPSGIQSWAWDFNGDSVVDSTQQNPSWTYTGCGSYAVSLTVFDGVNAPATLTRPGYVVTDELTPDFSYFLVAPNVLQFVDLTAPSATSWAWDLDGDAVTDSTIQAPIFFYPAALACGEVNVSLTVSRLCQGPVTLNRRIAVAQSLSTRFDGNFNSSTSTVGGTNYFDLGVLHPAGAVVCGMHCNVSGATGSPITVNVYATPGSYVGNHQNAAVWRLIGSGTATSLGVMQRTFVPVHFYLPQGNYGMAVQLLGRAPAFSNITANQTFSNADLTLTAGIAQGEPMFATASQVLNTRVWNGSLHYTTPNLVADAGYTFFAPGCAGSVGIASNTASSLPRIGQTMTLNVGNMPSVPAAVGFLMLGFSRTTSVLGPLPFDLTVIGAPGCLLRVSLDARILVVGTGGTAAMNFTFPASTGLLGIRFYTQALVLDVAANALGGVASDAAAGIIGQ